MPQADRRVRPRGSIAARASMRADDRARRMDPGVVRAGIDDRDTSIGSAADPCRRAIFTALPLAIEPARTTRPAAQPEPFST